MTSVKAIFNERKNEINTYFDYLNQYQPQNADDALFKILKSNLILMLYNLVESSISNAIEEIHNNIHLKSASFNDLKTELKSLIISNIKNVNSKKFVEDIKNIATDIIKHSFNAEVKKKLFNGNIDGRKIKEFSDKYGFDSNTDLTKTEDGNWLITIKNKRNDLAHGTYSFTEVGKDYSIQDLILMKDKTINYIESILDNIEEYLLNDKFKNN
ncbi:MAG: hypothetical protein LBG80_17090 [Bacteroidales bacterium]|jgi:hypothetical protein|nr:hypothetical protein [Bacteroidales bacterium]